MDFKFDLKFLKSDSNGISIWDGTFHHKLGLCTDDITHFGEIVDKMGIGSYKAQGLGQPVTSSYSLRGSNHTLYIICDNQHKVKGILKIGYKKLFIHNLNHEYEEMTPLCVLDFYVHESCQRKGIGKYLFEFMLKSQSIEPRLIAYDAPSPKLLNFLNKYYGLKSFTPQNCNFVLYHDYFQISDHYQYEKLNDDIIISHTPQNTESVSQNHPNESAIDKLEIVEHEEIKEEQDNNDDVVPISTFPHQTDTTSHDKQLEWITKQIEQTKLELRLYVSSHLNT